MTKTKIILREIDRYYISEGTATRNKDKATKFDSLEDLFTKVPIMRDWNWDYVVYKLVDNKEVEIPENEWRIIYDKMKSKGELYEQNNKVIPAFIRGTI